MLDPIFIGLVLGKNLQAHFIGKIELFKTPIVSWLIKGLGAICVDRSKADIGAVKEAADALSGIDSLAAQTSAQRTVLTGLSEAVRLNDVRLRTGLGPRIELLAAGDRLLAARQALVDLDADGAIRRIQLLIALGGDFTPAATDR
jgi:1-acyl-sn-glycerol-3-phosphate acyltransferase